MTSSEFNQECVKTLRRLRFEERVAVVGSGLSYHLVKDINELIDGMKRPCRVDKIDGEPNYSFFDRAYNNSPDEYYRVIKEAFGNTPPWDARVYWHLTKMRFKSFVTINYDDQLPGAFHKTRRQPSDFLFKVYPEQRIYLPPDLFGEKQHLVAVHGYKNRDNPNWHKMLILRGEDYRNHYSLKNGSQPPFLYLWWYWLLTTQPCVFIGTSLDEFGLAIVIRKIIESGNQSINGLHIHLKPTEAKAPDYTETCQKSLGVIEPVLYDKIDEDHKGLRIVLSQFSGEPEDGPAPLPEEKDFDIEDSLNFLKSYGGKSSLK